MSAPIRDEHRQAARALMQALGVEMSGEQGEVNEEAIAAVLAARDAAAVSDRDREIARLKFEQQNSAEAWACASTKIESDAGTISALRAEHATLTRALRRLSSATNTHPYLSTPLEELRAAWRDTGAALSLPLAKEVPDA